MLFNSVEFVVFLGSVFALYWLVFSRDLWWRNLFLWAASYLFYGWWDWRYLLLLAATSSVDFWVALQLGRIDDRQRRRRVLMLSLAGNLGVLATFKYFDFFASSLESAVAGLGVDARLLRLHLVLPVGLSFYTFQALSYTIDVYRRELEPCRRLEQPQHLRGVFGLAMPAPAMAAAADPGARGRELIREHERLVGQHDLRARSIGPATS